MSRHSHHLHFCLNRGARAVFAVMNRSCRGHAGRPLLMAPVASHTSHASSLRPKQRHDQSWADRVGELCNGKQKQNWAPLRHTLWFRAFTKYYFFFSFFAHVLRVLFGFADCVNTSFFTSLLIFDLVFLFNFVDHFFWLAMCALSPRSSCQQQCELDFVRLFFNFP